MGAVCNQPMMRWDFDVFHSLKLLVAKGLASYRTCMEGKQIHDD